MDFLNSGGPPPQVPNNIPDLTKLGKLPKPESVQVAPIINVVGMAPRTTEEAAAQDKLLMQARQDIAAIMQRYTLCRIDAFMGIFAV